MSDVVPSTHRDILTKEGFAHLASIGPDGEPQSHPVWYEYRDGDVLVSTTEGRQKLANVRDDPRVALTIEDPGNPYRYIEIRGTVDSIDQDEDQSFIDSLAQRYLSEETYPWSQPGDERVILVITVLKTNTMGEAA